MTAPRPKRRLATPAAGGVAEPIDCAYLALLRRELTRSQARLKRAEWERDELRAQVEKLLQQRKGRKRPPPG